jgi:SAM-dependent methyltransferase
VNKLRALVKRIGRFVLWPASRFFDPRFQGVSDAMNQVIVANSESIALLGRSIAEVEGSVAEVEGSVAEVKGSVAEVEGSVDELRAEVAQTREFAERASGAYIERLAHGTGNEIDVSAEILLEREGGSRGLAARRGLWFNSPVWVGYEGGDVVVRGVNERIAEVPFAFGRVARLEPGASILDVGATESTVSLSLASLGYDVTAIDIRAYPLTHPRLRTVAASIEDWDHDGTFDAVLCLSTIEHIGLAAYGAERKEGADIAAMRRMRELTKPDGLLVLTTRVGMPGQDGFQRTYDQVGLDALLEGWSIEELRILRREDETTWVPSEDGASATGGAEAVALVAATRPR